jgi:beta-exotoxin I transport system permease protein
MKRGGAELVRGPLRSMTRAGVSWAVAIALLIFATIAFWPALRGAALDELMNQIPSNLLQALGLQDFGTPAGYLRGNLYEILVPIMLAAAGVLMANGTTASDEDAGRLELVLAQPVQRAWVFAGRAVAVFVWLIAIGLVVAVTQFASDAIFDLQIDSGLLLATIVLSVLLGAIHAGLALAVAGIAARPGLVLAVGLGVAIFGYVVAALFPLNSALAPLQHLSPWDWALSGDPLSNGTDIGRCLILAVIAVALAAVGVVGFGRRDINAA